MKKKMGKPMNQVDMRKLAEKAALKKTEQKLKNIEGQLPEESRSLLHELRVHLIELEKQNKELRRIQAELDAARTRYFDLYDQAPSGYLTIGEKGLILEANLTAATLLGVTRDALQKRPIIRFIIRDDQEAYLRLSKQLMETGEPQECELQMAKKDGSSLWVHLSASAAQDENGAPVYRVMLNDITERKRDSEALVGSELRYRTFIDATSDLVFLKDESFRYLISNKANDAFMGRYQADVIGSTDFDLMPFEVAEHCRASDMEALKSKESFTAEEIVGANTYQTVKFPVPLSGGRMGVGGYIRDITGLKQAEEALRNSENKFYKAFSAIPDVLIISQRDDGLIIETNYSWESLFGYSREDVLGRRSLELGLFADPEDRRKIVAQLQELGFVHDYEVEIKSKTGEVRQTSLSAEPIEIDSKPCMLTIIHDITKRKEAERQLQIKNQMLTSINDYSQAIMSAEPDQLYETIVTRLKEITGAAEVFINDYDEEHNALVYRRSTLSEDSNTWLRKKLGSGFINMKTPVSKEHYDEIMGSTIGRVGSLHDVTFGNMPAPLGRIIEKAFGFGWFVGLALTHKERLAGTIMIAGKEGQAEPGNEELLAYASATANVLARRRAEVAMAESEAQYRLLSEHTTDTVWLVDMDLNMTYHSPSGERLRGFTIEEIMKMPLDRQFTPESFKVVSDLVFKELPRIMVDPDYNPLFTLDLEYSCRDGSTVWAESKFSIIRDGNGRPVSILGEGRDVTERKRAEENLKTQIKFISTLLDTIPSPIFYKDTSEKYLGCNRAFEEFFSKPREEIIGKSVCDIAPKEIADKYAKMDRELFERPGSQIYEWKVKTNNDSTREVIFNKATFTDSSGNVAGLVGVISDITERKKAEDLLQQAKDQYEQLFENINSGVAVYEVRETAGVSGGLDFIFKAFNSAGEKIDHDDRKRLIGKSIFEVRPGIEQAGILDVFGRVWRTGQPERLPVTLYEDKDLKGWYENYIYKLPTGEIVAVFENITERMQAEEEKAKLEAQLRQSQKMESVGRLAGGVAHDFNNMLSIIIGHADMLMSQIQPSDPAFGSLKEIMKAGERSAELTKQLLAFARKQVIAPVVLDLNDSISGILKMLGRLIGENISLSWKPAGNLWPVKMDPVQVNQILANLVVNSRDAIGDSGNITIETSNVKVDAPGMELYPDSAPGNYILLSVSDDGCGMDDETRMQIFEPFFTTKEQGKGTGLGLATVYGIVKQNNGFINVHSEPGKGTAFRIYLPACESVQPEGETPEISEAPKGTETVLLVEDETAVLGIYMAMLKKLGYTVLSASNPDDAVELARKYEDDIHILLSDVVMPGSGGSYLWKKLSVIRPGMKCLFMSGYTFDIIAKQGVLEEGVNYLQKPFPIEILARKIREVLDK